MINKILILVITLITTAVQANTVLPEIRTISPVSKADINRIYCPHGKITSIDYAAGTGLTHKANQDGKNVIILFKQLDYGTTKKLISKKVNLLVSCNNEYYPLVLDPQEVDSQTIILGLPNSEISAKKFNKSLASKTKDEIIVELIKQSRHNQSHNVNDINNKDIYIDDIKLKLVNKIDIKGTNYQVNKFVVITNKPIQLTEKYFINSKISPYKFAAVSLDDIELTQDKNYTHLHIVFNKGE
jgi:hypothetical protein